MTSGAKLVTSVADFCVAYIRQTHFLKEGSKFERDKAYFEAEALQIWLETIKTNSQSSIYMYES